MESGQRSKIDSPQSASAPLVWQGTTGKLETKHVVLTCVIIVKILRRESKKMDDSGGGEGNR